MSYRSAVPPLILILAATAGTLGCDTEARRQARAEKARRDQAWENGQRHEAETAPPTPEVLEQVRTATSTFVADHHPELGVEGTTFTPFTPNLFLAGVSVRDLLQGNRYVAQLTVERLRDVDEDGEAGDNARLLWVVDYASPERMKELAERHGFAREVDRIRDQDRENRVRSSWGQRSWLDDYLLWHVLFNRPSSFGWRSGGGFAALPSGFRPQDPEHPIGAADAAPFRAAAAPTGGRSEVFLGGGAWRPPLVSTARSLPGQGFVAGPHGSISGRTSLGVSRGGFGAAGHFAGAGG